MVTGTVVYTAVRVLQSDSRLVWLYAGDRLPEDVSTFLQ